MERRQVRFGLIGLGLMGREFGSSVARWCHLLDNGPLPVITGVCNKSTVEARKWFKDNFDTIHVVTGDYRELLDSSDVDAIYCAVPHNLHEKMYKDIISSGKHLLGEKPFGIDREANKSILESVADHPELVVRCSSEFPYFPGAQRLVRWLREKRYGRLMEARAGFHHSSDMDLAKPINWKRMIDTNGEYGCMGDLGMHIQHIPFRMGWIPATVYADLQNIAETRPDKAGNTVPCETWDNAVLTCRCADPDSGKDFSLVLETKRMAPGQTNTWFLEVYGTKGSARFSTHEPRAFYSLETKGREQAWSRLDTGYETAIPTITGAIFEFGFTDTFLQMLGAFMYEFREDGKTHPFGVVTPEETALSHRVMTAALESHRTGARVALDTVA